MSAGKNIEAGIQPYRLEFLRESTKGEVQANPEWLLYSDTARTVDPGIDPSAEAQYGLGDASPKNHFTGVHGYELTVEYDLQRAINNGTNDASDDAIQRDSDNRLSNSHAVQRRMDQSALDASNTVNGSTSLDTRRYLIAKGGLADVTYTGDPSDSQPVLVTLEYVFEKAEIYQIDQPDADNAVAVESTSSNDTTQDVTIEDEGAATSTTLSLNGTTLVDSGSTTFTDIDVVDLSAETEGSVNVYQYDTGTSSTVYQLATIPGQNAFDHGEGALGIPALGSGDHEGSIGGDYEQFIGDSIERPSGTDLADNVATYELSIDNNVAAQDTATGPRPFTYSEEQVPTVDGTVFGEVEYFAQLRDALESDAQNLLWNLDSDTLQVDNAQPVDVSGTEEATQGLKEIDVTWQGEGVTVS